MKFTGVRAAIVAAVVALQAGPALAQNIYGQGVSGLPGYGSDVIGRWFVDGHVGAGWGNFSDFKLAGTQLVDTDTTSTSVTSKVGIGYYMSNEIFARLSYGFLGALEAKGTVATTGGQRKLPVAAHALLFGLGANLDVSRDVFIEATGDIGLSFLDSETNFALGTGLGLGYRLDRNIDLVAMGNYYWLGEGSSGAPVITGDLGVATATVGVRVRF